ncbi:hypothetical protein MLD38_012467 [Melastoma candidum]|uniref:Uncharacterized protein n=1 Tax=Melastoma candidum TaxID=119954 RepID=A0ACB9RAK8_9MYRT|nr:hypothetical protein MLD38_012467 [Melastoma candidum]
MDSSFADTCSYYVLETEESAVDYPETEVDVDGDPSSDPETEDYFYYDHDNDSGSEDDENVERKGFQVFEADIKHKKAERTGKALETLLSLSAITHLSPYGWMSNITQSV